MSQIDPISDLSAFKSAETLKSQLSDMLPQPVEK